MRARGRSRARPDGGRPAAVAQAAGKLLRASLGPAPAPHASGRAAWPRRAPPFRFPTQVLRGLADPDSAQTGVEPAAPPMTPMQPVVRLTVDKAQTGRWGGLIEQMGEDSLIQ